MMRGLGGKVILLTGGASGIGLATVKKLLEHGATVAVGDLSPDPSEGLAALIGQGNDCAYLQLDVSSRQSAHSFTSWALHRYGRIDGLVNNAGISLDEGEGASDETFDKILAVNLKGVWYMGTEVLQVMKAQPQKGVIVNTASTAALKGISGLAAYCSSKHAVLGLTKAWCKQWTPLGIRINAICPGMTDTPLLAGVGAGHDKGPEYLEKWRSNVPLGRLAQPEEMADVICFLLSEESSYMSGQAVRVGGGEGD